MAGPATVGGGELDRSQYYPEGWWDGVAVNKEVMKGQGVKAPPFDRRTPLQLIGGLWAVRRAVKLTILPASHFPKELPISVHEIPGVIKLVAVPVEMTTAVGLRTAGQLKSSVEGTPVQLIGL